jgi:uncharacterized protein YjbI with pentapeptide repeats
MRETLASSSHPTPRAADITTAIFIPADYFAANFLAADFLATDLLATNFLAVDFIVVDFLASNFLAADFFAADFLASDFISAVSDSYAHTHLSWYAASAACAAPGCHAIEVRRFAFGDIAARGLAV